MSARKQSQRRRNLAVLDFETDPFLHDRVPEPFCVEFYSDKHTEVFWGDDCAKQFVDWLKTLDEPYTIYAHNGGKFDFHFLHEYIDNPALIINSRIVKCNLLAHELRDSFAILPVPLRDFEKMDFDYAKMERDVREENKEEILTYLHVDCLSLYKAVSAFIARFGMQLTIGGTAIKELRKTHPFSDQGPNHDRCFRPYYFGGRVEVWKGGVLDGPWKIVDRNSMYPSVMAYKNHPINGRFEQSTTIPDGFERPYFLTFTGSNRNALPTRGHDGDLVFGQEYGLFHTCSHELEVALKYGLVTIDEVHDCWVSCEYTKFDTFVFEHAALKEEAKRGGDVLNYVFEKLIMNSAYGRAGINPENFEDWIIHRDFGNEFEMEMKGYSQQADYEIMELWSKHADVKDDQYCDVSIAASITSGARADLLEALQFADSPIYCDTDSIICRDYHGDMDKFRLGAWDLEKEAAHVAIAGRKLYALYDDPEGKAVKLSSKGGTLSLQDLIKICKGEIVTYHNAAPTFSLKRKPSFVTRRFRKTTSELVECD